MTGAGAHDGGAAAAPHLRPEALDDFFVGGASRFELGRAALRHLEETCLECHRRVTAAGDLDGVFEEAERRARAIVEEIEREREALRDLLAELWTLEPAQTAERVRRDRRCHTLAFAEHQLEVGWLALEAGDHDVVGEARDLAHAALDGADPTRYGRPALGTLRAESWFLAARLGTAQRDGEAARRALEEADRLLARFGKPADLAALGQLTRAEIEMLSGRFDEARRLAEAAAGAEDHGVERWSLSVERRRAELERLTGGSKELVARVGETMYELRPSSAAEWSLALELGRALLETGETDESLVVCAMWRAEEEGAGPGGQVESEVLRGAVLGATGRRYEGRRILEAARVRSCVEGDGWRAVEATVELFRLAEAAGEAARLQEETWKLSGVSLCRNVPQGVLRTLAEFGTAVWQGHPWEVLELERRLRLGVSEADERVETT